MQTAETLFVQVVKAGSFKRAAEQLNLEPSSLSRKVAALEDRLKVKLLHRSTRHTRPTELGQRYFEGLCKIIDEQAALEEGISSRVELLSGNFRVSAPIDFGVEFVVPAIRRLQQDAPGLVVDITLGSGFIDLLEQGIDVAIRIGEQADSNLIARQLGQANRVLVASPEYLDVHGVPESPEDLSKHNFILYSQTQARSDIEFTDSQRVPHSRIRSTFTVNSVRAIRKLVREGAGVHLGPKWAFQEDIDSNRVICLLPEHPLKSFPVHAVYPARSYLPRKTKLFIHYMTELLSRLPA